MVWTAFVLYTTEKSSSCEYGISLLHRTRKNSSLAEELLASEGTNSSIELCLCASKIPLVAISLVQRMNGHCTAEFGGVRYKMISLRVLLLQSKNFPGTTNINFHSASKYKKKILTTGTIQ
jgi:hypothetical protein